jgi:hypothetical protein
MAVQPERTERMADGRGAHEGVASALVLGLVEGTKVATEIGWRPVEGIAVGDKALTFDAGLQPVASVTRRPLWMGEGDCPERFWPVGVPAGALGNRAPICMLANQPIMLESDAAEEIFGDPFTLVPATALIGVRGIAAVPPEPGLEAVVLDFEDEQVVFTDSGALFLAPSSRDLLDHALSAGEPSVYEVLPVDTARTLIHQFKADFTSACVSPAQVALATSAA